MGRRGPPPTYTDEIKVSLRPDTRSALVRLAEERGTSVSALVRRAINSHYEERSDAKTTPTA